MVYFLNLILILCLLGRISSILVGIFIIIQIFPDKRPSIIGYRLNLVLYPSHWPPVVVQDGGSIFLQLLIPEDGLQQEV